MSDKEFDKKIGALLKAAREKAHMTQQEVADMFVSKIVRKKKRPRETNLPEPF